MVVRFVPVLHRQTRQFAGSVKVPTFLIRFRRDQDHTIWKGPQRNLLSFSFFSLALTGTAAHLTHETLSAKES